MVPDEKKFPPNGGPADLYPQKLQGIQRRGGGAGGGYIIDSHMRVGNSKGFSGDIFRTYAEEENCEAIFRRSGSEFIILRIPSTENGTFFGQKTVETSFFQ
jgi:hypothetical protein